MAIPERADPLRQWAGGPRGNIGKLSDGAGTKVDQGRARRAVGRHAAGHTVVRGTEIMEYRPANCGLLRLDVARADHLAPLLDFIGDELAVVGG